MPHFLTHGALCAFLVTSALISCAESADAPLPALGELAQQSDGGAQSGAEARFSFFVTSQRGLQQLSGGQDGFGGDLRFGETGEGAGLRGADKICAALADESMPGAGSKSWRAFLSATRGGPSGGPVHAVERVGGGPWYDRLGRLVARDPSDLAQVRPRNADPQVVNDLPNEDGVPNRAPDGFQVDNHHILTGSDSAGRLYKSDPRVTCDDWTSSRRDVADAPRVGLSWPRTFPGGGGFRPPGGRTGGGRRFGDAGVRFEDGGIRLPDGTRLDPSALSGATADSWISALDESGCAPGGNIVNAILPNQSDPTVGSGGGYGAIYCFALTP